MKILSRDKIYQIDIMCVLNTEHDSNVAAGHDVTVEERDIDFKYQLTNQQLSAYRNFVRSCVSIIKNFGFDISDKPSRFNHKFFIRRTLSVTDSK